jgi:type II secretion system protein C
MKWNRLKVATVVAVLALFSELVWADAAQLSDENFLVLGVIASTKDKAGIALMKNMKSGKTVAVKQSTEFEPGAILKYVSRKHVTILVKNQLYRIEVGGDVASAVPMDNRPRSSSTYVANVGQEVQIEGNTVKVSSTFKDHMVNNNLDKILMQAAAVPYVVDGKLKGFELWEIEKNSIFDVAGFKDGDLITKINDKEINDIAMTIRILSSLKNAPQAKFDYMRNGANQNLTIVVQ